MSYFDQASLVMIPSGYKTSKVYSIKPTDGSGDMSFSRSNDTATRVNSAGLIEKVRTNLLFPSNNWVTLTASGSATNNTTANPIDGAVTAGTLTGAGFWGKNVSASGIHTMSVYVKAGTVNAARLNIYNGSTDIGVTFNLTTGASSSEYGTIVNKGAVNAGNGWWRLYLSVNCTSALYAQLHVDSAGTVFAYALQGETGDIATDYIATTSAAVSVGPVANVPRLDYLNSSCPRLLLEGQRTNSLTYSEQFDNATYTKLRLTTSANTSVSPDGNTNADSIFETADNNTHELYQRPSVTSAQPFTFSCFIKANGRRRVQLQIFDSSTLFASALFDVISGEVIATSGTSKIENYGNGWYRCAITGVSPTTSTGYALVGLARDTYTNATVLDSYAGDITKGVLLYGAQGEANAAYATSYIPTLGAAVTRGADACSKTGISSLIGQTEGTIFMDWIPENQNPQTHFSMGDGGSDIIAFWGSNQFAFYSSGGVLIVGGTINAGQRVKAAFTYKNNDYSAFVNGVEIGSDTSASVPTCDRIFVGQWVDGTEKTKQNINQLLLFPTRLTNAQLAELTTI